MESTEEERKIFRGFLDNYCQSDACSAERDTFPFRLDNTSLTSAEIEAECIDLCIQYLGLKECPARLLIHLAREVAASVSDQDHQQLLWSSQASVEAAPEESNSSDDTVLIEDKDDDPLKEKTPVVGKEKLARIVKREIDCLCQQWREELPPLAHFPSSPLMSAHALRNVRRKMEDRHVVFPHVQHLFPNPHEGSYHYYAVFDGHGGVEAASYAAAHLHCHLVKHPAFPTDIKTALHDAFVATDENFVSKAKREHLRSGSTGVCAVLSENHLHIGWLGDSQALLVKGGTPITIMEPHKPERPDEKKRIEDLGGCVVWFGAWRVNGTLSVSRAIGDAEYKPYVSGEPDLCSIELTGDEDYLVLGCDGLWDCVTDEQVVRHVHQHMQTKGRATLAQSLVKLAMESGSSDNISVIVVLLKDKISAPNIIEKETDGPFKFGEPDDDSEDDEDEDFRKKEKKSKEQPPSSDTSPPVPQLSSGDSVTSALGITSSPPKISPPKIVAPLAEAEDFEDDDSLGICALPAVRAAENRIDEIFVKPQSPIQFSSILRSLNQLNEEDQQNEKDKEIDDKLSQGEMAIMAHTANNCVHARRGRKGRHGHRRNHKENRRCSKEKSLASSSSSSSRTMSPGPRSLSSRPKKPDLVHLLTGVPAPKPRRKPRDTWTVAVEIEVGASLFEDK